MDDRHIKRNTGLFITFIFLAGVICFFDSASNPLVPNTFTFCLLFVVYAGLIFFWMQSILDRLIPSISRRYALAAGVLMLMYLLIRTIKYRLINTPVLDRIFWYLYYVPELLMSTLFLMTCIRFYSGKESPPRELGLLIPAVLLIGMVLTNDLHYLAFSPKAEQAQLTSRSGTYSLGIFAWAAFVWIGLTIALGVFILLWRAHRMHQWKRSFGPISFLLAMPVVIALNDVLQTHGFRKFYQVPETYILCMLGVFETCIRLRLMPRNENYPDFFARMRVPALITDRHLSPAYQSAVAPDATPIQLRDALTAPQALDEDRQLFGKALRGGCAFWIKDESTLHRLNDRLEAANETISLENRLIEYENRQCEEKARIDARNAVYAKAAMELYPVQKRIAALLEAMTPGTPAFRGQLARVCALNAFVKRKTNLILTYRENDCIDLEELYLAIREVTGFLSDCGTLASVARRGPGLMTYADTMALYDAFLGLAEALLPRTKRMMVFLHKNALRITADCEPGTAWPELSCRLSVEYADGFTYLTLTAKEGDAA